MVSDWRNFESWHEAGSPTAATKTAALASQLLAEYRQPTIEEAVLEEIGTFVAPRRRGWHRHGLLATKEPRKE